MPRTAKLLVLVLVCLLLSPSFAGKKKKVKARDLVLGADYTEITDTQRKLDSVPFAKGAPAVVLFKAKQAKWDERLDFQRIAMHRRVKLLDASAAENYGDYVLELRGDWRVKKVKARTILPDGQIVEALEDENVYREKGEDDEQTVRVAFPKAGKGAILDLIVEVTAGPWFVSPFELQESLPVLEARAVLIPPPPLRYRTAVIGLDPKLNEPLSVKVTPTAKAFIWRFENLEALPSIANLPPSADIAKRFLVMLDSYKSPSAYFEIAHDWPSFCKLRHSYWKEWRAKRHVDTHALAKQVAAAQTTPEDKAEAIRLALQERLQLNYFWSWPMHDAPDQALSEGRGSSGDFAGLAATMLAAVGVEAEVYGFQRRSDGSIPADIPIPALLDDVLVRFEGTKGPTFFSPASRIAVGQLPWDCTGILAVPFVEGAAGPIPIPDAKAGDNKTRRKAKVKLLDNGDIEGETTNRYSGVAAELVRRRLRDRDDASQRARVQSWLRVHMPGLSLSSLELEGIDEADGEVVVKVGFTVEGYGVQAGKRLLVNPFLFSRILTEDWAEETRAYPVSLGVASHEIEEIQFELPEGVTEAAPPGLADLNAGPAGYYKSTVNRRGTTLVAKRQMRLNMYAYAAEQYPQLRGWFLAIAEADDRPIVVTMP